MTRDEDPSDAAVVFRVARAEDLPALVAIDASSPTPWSSADFGTELAHEPATLFVLRSEGEIVGFIVTRVQATEMDIVNVAIAPRHRRRGLGRRMLEALLTKAADRGITSVFLEVRESNAEARALYQGLGFEETQRRRAFYKEPVEDAVLMRRAIEAGRG